MSSKGLSRLFERITKRDNGNQSNATLKTPPPSAPVTEAESPANLVDLIELDKQVKRLSKEVYKANTLAEAQIEQTKQVISQSQQTLQTLTTVQANAGNRERLDLIKALFPVIDSIETGISSGIFQIKTMVAVSPDAASLLANWLIGQRLLLERLLAILEAEGVKTIPTVGQVFDPYQHVVVKTVKDPAYAPGVILKEERKGYVFGADVLRYADVIVNKESKGAG